MEMDCCGSCCFGWILKQVEKDLKFKIKYSVRGWEFAKRAIFWVLKRCHDYPIWVREDSEDVSPCRRNSLHHFWKIFTFLTSSFEAFKLRDMDIAAKLLLCAYDLLLFRQNAEIHIWEFSWVHLQNCSKKITENDFKLLMKATYTDEEVRHVLTRVVWTIVKNGNVFFLQNLLRYGVMCLPPRSASLKQREQFLEAVQYLTYQDNGGYISPLSRDIWKCRTNRRTLHVLRVVELLAFELKERQTNRNASFWDLRSTRLRRDRITFDPESARFKCLKMVFDTIPEPFVTSEELREVLQLAHANRCDSRSKMLIDALVSGFKMMHPESEGSVTPRSLKHLSRCQLRDSLRQTGALPHGIHELELPSYIQAYVLLEKRSLLYIDSSCDLSVLNYAS